MKRVLLTSAADENINPLAELERLSQTPETDAMSRSRDRIMSNLDDMYREAFESAKRTDDDAQMRSLDFAYRREQLYFEILLDIRDAMMARK